MGYESRVYIVTEYPTYAWNELAYGEVIAMFDLRKMGYWELHGMRFTQLFAANRTCEFYADDGNTIISEDCYGDAVYKAGDNRAVINWLKAYVKDNDWYAAKVFLDALLSLEKNHVSYSLYHYGY